MTIDLSQFHQVFFEESFEGLEVMEAALLGLDPDTAERDAIDAIFRAAHSIKGGSGTFGFTEVADFTHLLETLLDGIRGGRRAITPALVDLLLRAVDCVREMLAAVQSGRPVNAPRVQSLRVELQQSLQGGSGGTPAGGSDPGEATPGAAGSGWRIGFRPLPHLFLTGNDPARLFRELESLGSLECRARLDALPPLATLDPEACHLAWELVLHGSCARAALEEVFAWVEGDCELVIEPLRSGVGAAPVAVETAAPSPATTPMLAPAPEERRSGERRQEPDRRAGAAGPEASSIRVGIDKVDALINLVGELVITQSMLSQVGERFEMADLERLRAGLAQLERNTRELQASVMGIRMLPIKFAFSRFPRLVHDLSAKLGKQVELRLSGEQTELDKTVMERIGDPLVHLVRNALDHGIELPEARVAAGKSPAGLLHLDALHEGGNIVIRISDDGAGMNVDRILAKARERGLVGAEESLSRERILNLIFEPGFSLAERVTDVSGRGVGMDVVRRNIQDLGGAVEIHSEPGRGSRFTIRLPLTLAILDGQLLRVGPETYILPLVAIAESLQVQAALLTTVAGNAELYRLREEYIPIVRLGPLLGVQPESADLTQGLLVVVEGEGRRIGICVDELLGQQQVVIKSLETNYQRVEGVSGATILGDGSVALILDVPGLIRLARRLPLARAGAGSGRETDKAA